ncbi:MAG TPA: hypothetical protein VKG43_01800 [Acidimicrobiales bacterium]|nr:hypothetical protein [Acidimicrobiales bacterium]
MATVLIVHEVDDVEHWLSSPKREEVFGPMGIRVRTFVDAERTQLVGLVVDDISDMDSCREAMGSEAAADAMRFDGVRPETLVMLVES